MFKKVFLFELFELDILIDDNRARDDRDVDGEKHCVAVSLCHIELSTAVRQGGWRGRDSGMRY
jgi:hypothetical protein